MNKTILLVCASLLSLVFIMHSATALCTPTVSLLNQDPYPANPGEYVKLVFELTGVDNPECRTVNFMLQQDYPISLDPGVSPSVTLKGGAYLLDYGTFFIIPYKVRIDPNAVDENYTLKVNYGVNNENNPLFYHTSNFDLAVNDTSADFEVFVDSYAADTKTLTLNIVNIGKNDANALTVSVPSQNGLNITSGSDKIVGKLSSTDDTTVSFTATPSNTDSIKVALSYTDSVGKRRVVEKTVPFSSSTYVTTQKTNSSLGLFFYLFLISWIAIIGYWFYSRRRRKKADSLKKHS